jgi:hypothetical protein
MILGWQDKRYGALAKAAKRKSRSRGFFNTELTQNGVHKIREIRKNPINQ